MILCLATQASKFRKCLSHRRRLNTQGIDTTKANVLDGSIFPYYCKLAAGAVKVFSYTVHLRV